MSLVHVSLGSNSRDAVGRVNNSFLQLGLAKHNMAKITHNGHNTPSPWRYKKSLYGCSPEEAHSTVLAWAEENGWDSNGCIYNGKILTDIRWRVSREEHDYGISANSFLIEQRATSFGDGSVLKCTARWIISDVRELPRAQRIIREMMESPHQTLNQTQAYRDYNTQRSLMKLTPRTVREHEELLRAGSGWMQNNHIGGVDPVGFGDNKPSSKFAGPLGDDIISKPEFLKTNRGMPYDGDVPIKIHVERTIQIIKY